MSNLYPKGSEWRKWDLHIHTPDSVVQHYGENNAKTWEKFISDLENLPKEFSVLGINDYLFLDGYERLKNEKDRNKRLKNIDLLLPVVEFRIEKFAGVDFGALKRINLHVIFSNELELETIKSQFLNALEQSYKLDSGDPWTRSISRESVAELGREIKTSVPSAELKKYGNDLEEGFNNLNVDEKQIYSLLKRDCFKNKYLIAVGKTEWDSLSWTGASIATKKTIINSADIIFTAAQSVEVFQSAKEKLSSQGVKDLLLDCSDAHYFSSQKEQKDRVGNCYTWIKSDPTFEGLQYIVYEPEERVFIGNEPEIIARVNQGKTKYIKSLKIDQKSAYKDENGLWYKDIEINFNKELVAIIGNKGSGKSSISDILGLLGDTHNAGENNENLSFLNNSGKKRRFRQRGFAENFEATILWESGKPVTKPLDAEIDITQPEQVKYLPQNFFEALTNDLEGQGFEKTLKSVIFLHIPEAKRFSKESFEELEEYKSRSIEKDVLLLRASLKKTAAEIVVLENKKHPDYEKEIKNKLKLKDIELREHNKVKPKEKRDPTKNVKNDKEQKENIKKIDDINNKITEFDGVIDQKESERAAMLSRREELQQFLDDANRFNEQLKSYIDEHIDVLKRHGLDIKKVIRFDFKIDVIKRKIKSYSSKISGLESLLKTEQEIKLEYRQETHRIQKAKNISLIVQRDDLQVRLSKYKDKLSQPERAFQEYKEKLKRWREILRSIEGDPADPRKYLETLEYYKSELKFLDENLSGLLVKKRGEMIEEAVKILRKKKEVLEIYEEFKSSIDKRIAMDKRTLEKFKMNIDVSFRMNKEYNSHFLEFIDKRREGSFYTKAEGEKNLNKIFEEKNLTDERDIRTILNTLVVYLESDQREGLSPETRSRNIGDQVSRREEFYEFVFALDYLTPNYELKLDNKTLNELSPGEKGALLLVFYLSIDTEDMPLIIDQPEDNLDNQSVFNVLTHFIRAAKKRRQIIVVTHNPNLAVGADAEQILYVSLDKKKKNKFSCETGSIENPSINKHIVDILEGTMPAFDKRKLKYFE